MWEKDRNWPVSPGATRIMDFRTTLNSNTIMKTRVLIAEDNHLFAETIGKILKKAGYEVLVLKEFTRKNYRAGLKFKPDVALLDHDLGKGLTGKMVAADLKLPANRMVSISSGSFDTSYCEYRFVTKDYLCRKDAKEKDVKLFTEHLLEDTAKAVKNSGKPTRWSNRRVQSS